MCLFAQTAIEGQRDGFPLIRTRACACGDLPSVRGTSSARPGTKSGGFGWRSIYYYYYYYNNDDDRNNYFMIMEIIIHDDGNNDDEENSLPFNFLSLFAQNFQFFKKIRLTFIRRV